MTSDFQHTLLRKLNTHSAAVLEGRYPDVLPIAPDIEIARNELRQAQEVFEWLIQRL